MPVAKKKVAAQAKLTKTVRELRRELAVARKELEQQRRFNRQLARKVLPLLPKKLEDQIPSIDEIKKMAATQPSLLDIIDSLQLGTR